MTRSRMHRDMVTIEPMERSDALMHLQEMLGRQTPARRWPSLSQPRPSTCLLPWCTQNTHVSGDDSRVRCASSMASCDLLCSVISLLWSTVTMPPIPPNAAEADKRSPRARYSAYCLELQRNKPLPLYSLPQAQLVYTQRWIYCQWTTDLSHSLTPKGILLTFLQL